jgi:HSP20 family molecular chaperone IbpA
MRCGPHENFFLAKEVRMPLSRITSEFNPLNTLLGLQQELNRVLEKPPGFSISISGRGVFPPSNIFSEYDSYVVCLEVPGVIPEQITIESPGGTLVINGADACRFNDADAVNGYGL